jgi:hypothetical protein
LSLPQVIEKFRLKSPEENYARSKPGIVLIIKTVTKMMMMMMMIHETQEYGEYTSLFCIRL